MSEVYEQLKSMTVGFAFRPSDRLNEGALARDLGVSRTPLREALNRLVAEGLIDARPGEGFFCRGLTPETVFHLYDLREALELAAVTRACARASDAALSDLADWLTAEGLDVTGLTVGEACARDEEFHMRIAGLAENPVLSAQLGRINEQIRYLRWVQLDPARLKSSKDGHRRVMQALLDRDADAATTAMQAHISRRLDQITDAVSKGISHIYMDRTAELTEAVIKGTDT